MWWGGGMATVRPRVVLMYHSVASRPVLGHLTVALDEFKWQLDALGERYRFGTVGDALDGNAGGGPVVALTFDDGYEHLVPHVTDVLQEYRVPATFYVPTALVGGSIDTSYGTVKVMDWDTVKALPGMGFHVGSHTKTHRTMSQVSGDEAWDEIRESKTDLEEQLGVDMEDFAYPKGVTTTESRRMVEEAGYARAVTVVQRSVGRATDPLLVPRVGVFQGVGRARFKVGLSRLGDLYAALRGIGRNAAG